MIENAKLVKEKDTKHMPFAFKMTKGVFTITKEASAYEAAKIMQRRNIGALIVEHNDKLAGILSERDIVHKVVAKDKPAKKTLVKDIMTKDVITINIKDGIKTIHDKIKGLPFRHLPVREGKNIIGMVSNRDLMYLKQLKTKKRG